MYQEKGKEAPSKREEGIQTADQLSSSVVNFLAALLKKYTEKQEITKQLPSSNDFAPKQHAQKKLTFLLENVPSMLVK